MGIKAIPLKDGTNPSKTALYCVKASRPVRITEKQMDGTSDEVELAYTLEEDEVGYYSNEYRPEGVEKEGSKVIDITALVVSEKRKQIRWHLYDIKDTLAGMDVVIKLYSQWNSGFHYMKEHILACLPDYEKQADLGAITRRYDKERLRKILTECQNVCNADGDREKALPLAMRKKKTEIARFRAAYTACSAILDGVFRPECESDSFPIRIRILEKKSAAIYYTWFKA